MDYSFHILADKEVEEIITYYDGIHEPLGDQFFSELQNAISRVLQLPDAWQKISPSARRCLLKRFPYQLAVMHLHREPNYWVNRL